MRHIVIALIFLATSPAQADWQYTKWGMTPQEVVTASNGLIEIKYPDRNEPKNKKYIGCSGGYTTGSFHFYVSFVFDPQDRLAEVSLLTSPSTDQDAVIQALEEKYGRWKNDIFWYDERNNYAVKARKDYGLLFVEYYPLHHNERGGL